MASTHSVSYPLGGTQTELQRLLAQAEVYEPDSNREALLRHLNDPATIVIDKLFVQSWGRKSS